MTVVDLASLGRWIHHFFVARVSPNRAGYPKRHVGVQLARSFACAVMEQRWPCSGIDR